MKNKKTVILTCALALLAALALFVSFNMPQSGGTAETPQIAATEITGNEISNTGQAEEVLTPEPTFTEAPEAEQEVPEAETVQETQSAPADAPMPQEAAPEAPAPPASQTESAQAAPEADKLTCTLSVRCDTVLNNMSHLKAGKAEIVPKNGVIYEEREVLFNEGESVFNVLVREMKLAKIHMEFENVPLYKSAYIEGIGNLYEFDCGELSGWMYKVNGVYPNYGCSQYKLSQGDKVEWVYTCNLGEDVGGKETARNGKKNETE